jgi:VanZ family protein
MAERRRVRLFKIASAGVVFVMLALVLAPTPSAATTPVEGVHDVLREAGAPHWLRYEPMWEAFFNVLLFVPIGVIGAVLLPRWPWWAWLLVGLALSGAIELTQGLFLPRRHGDPVDVVTNTAGAVLGAWAVKRRTRPARDGQAL